MRPGHLKASDSQKPMPQRAASRRFVSHVQKPKEENRDSAARLDYVRRTRTSDSARKTPMTARRLLSSGILTRRQSPTLVVRTRPGREKEAQDKLLPYIKKAVWPWKIGELLSAGFQGCVWDVYHRADYGYVLKVADVYGGKARIEGALAKKAGKLGIGPPIYHVAPISMPDGSTKEIVLMHKLAGPSLDLTYPYRVRHVKAALQLYHALLKAGIAQRDLKPNNLLFDADGRLYLIDYGIASEYKYDGSVRDFQHMVTVGNLLIDTMTSRDHEGGGSRSWSDDRDRARATRVLIYLVRAANEWLKYSFPRFYDAKLHSSHINPRWSHEMIVPNLPEWTTYERDFGKPLSPLL